MLAKPKCVCYNTNIKHKECAALMKFMDSKIKNCVYTFLMYLVVMFEMSVLSGFRFVTGAADKYGNGLSAEKVGTLKLVGANIGWNYIVCSVIIILAMFGFALWIGYNRNFGGVIGMIFINLLPFLGLIIPNTACYNFFWGYGTAHFLPAMSLFGMHTGGKVPQIIFIAVVLVLTVVFFFIGKAIRAKHAEKYEYDD